MDVNIASIMATSGGGGLGINAVAFLSQLVSFGIVFLILWRWGFPAITGVLDKRTEVIQEGIENLNKAIQLRPDYDDAMAYLNLMYREKADVECDDLNARQEDLKTADHWVDQTLSTKKAKAEKQPGQQGITMDQPK